MLTTENLYTNPETTTGDTGNSFELMTEPRVTASEVAYTFEMACRREAMRIAELVIRKHRDYGPKNILESPFGVDRGLITRLWDKIQRLKNIFSLSTPPQNESIDDNFDDIGGYAIIRGMTKTGTFTLPLAEEPTKE